MWRAALLMLLSLHSPAGLRFDLTVPALRLGCSLRTHATSGIDARFPPLPPRFRMRGSAPPCVKHRAKQAAMKKSPLAWYKHLPQAQAAPLLPGALPVHLECRRSAVWPGRTCVAGCRTLRGQIEPEQSHRRSRHHRRRELSVSCRMPSCTGPGHSPTPLSRRRIGHREVMRSIEKR
jgi:hypothetical protein